MKEALDLRGINFEDGYIAGVEAAAFAQGV